tara:strand:- start:488 stop:1216 length:729 start_codon:yes stop_codon:yes gene_type:complete
VIGVFDIKYYKWAAIIPGFILGDFIGAIAAYFLVQEIVAKRIQNTDYELALLKVCIKLMSSDGSIDKVEIDSVRLYFKRTFGVERTNQIFRDNKTSKFKNFTLTELSEILKTNTNPNNFYSILQFLYYVSAVDGNITIGEDEIIHTIGYNLGFTESRILAIKSQFTKTSYKSAKYDSKTVQYLNILGLDDKATTSDIKSAYRTLAKELHPDRLTGVSDGIKEMAKEKFLKVQEAYEYLNGRI